MSAAQGSIVVSAPVGDVYRQWLRVEDSPKFIPTVKEVQKLDGEHFAIVFSFNGKRHEGVLEIMLRAPKRRLPWRALAGGASNYLASGVVSFTSRPNRRTLRDPKNMPRLLRLRLASGAQLSAQFQKTYGAPHE
jgi:uncharacterized membrane protein